MADFQTNRQRVTDPAEPLVFLELTAASFSGPAYLVADTDDWVRQGRTYTGVQFRFKEPDSVSGQSPRLELGIGNVGRGFSEELERLGPNEQVMVRFIMTDRANVDGGRELLFPISRASISTGEMSAQAGVDSMMRQQAVQLRANPYTLPGIF